MQKSSEPNIRASIPSNPEPSSDRPPRSERSSKVFVSNNRLFAYTAGSKATISMREGGERAVYAALNELVAQTKEVKEMDENAPARLVLEYKIEILVQLALFDNRNSGVDLVALKNRILLKTLHGDAVSFREAVQEILNLLQIEAR